MTLVTTMQLLCVPATVLKMRILCVSCASIIQKPFMFAALHNGETEQPCFYTEKLDCLPFLFFIRSKLPLFTLINCIPAHLGFQSYGPRRLTEPPKFLLGHPQFAVDRRQRPTRTVIQCCAIVENIMIFYLRRKATRYHLDYKGLFLCLSSMGELLIWRKD